MSLFKSSTTLGIDLGSRNIKVVELQKKGEQVLLKRNFFLDLALSNQEYPNQRDLKDTLRALMEAQKLKNGKVITSLKDQAIQTYDLQLPDLSEKELKSTLQLDMEQKFEGSLDQITFDYYKMSRSDVASDRSGLYKIFWAKKSDLKEQCDLLSGISLSPSSVDINVLAIAAMLEFNEYTKPNHNSILIELGELHTTTALILDSQVHLMSVEAVGVGNINQTLMNEGQMSYLDSEKLKERMNLSANPEELSEVEQRVDNLFIGILNSIQKNIDYFMVHSKDFPLSNIFVVGGGCARHPELCQIFEDHYKIKTLIPNPFRKVELFSKDGSDGNVDFDQLAPFMATAVGLALAGVA